MIPLEALKAGEKRPTIYISGQLSQGDTLPPEKIEANKDAFRYAAVHIARLNYGCVNPITLDHAPDDNWATCMRRCLAALMRCDYVCLLPGWEQSRGARLEVRTARDVGMGFVYSTELDLPARPSGVLPLYVDPESPRALSSLSEGPGALSAVETPAASLVSQESRPERLPIPSSSLPERLPLPFAGYGEKLPTRGFADDAGLDLYVDLRNSAGNAEWQPLVLPPRSFADIPCNLAVALPTRVWGMITARSSTIRKRGLLVNTGIIDTGFRGQLYAGVWNLTDMPVEIRHGERLAQLILFPNITQNYDPVRVAVLPESDRGTNGFGSTGA